MKGVAWPRIVACTLWLIGSGCTALREIPRSEYASRAERQHVRATTNQGLIYEFDYAQLRGDSLVGFSRRDLGGPTADYVSFALALEDITSLSTRGVDWHRTALLGGGVVAGVVAAALTASKDKPVEPGDSGGGGGGRVP